MQSERFTEFIERYWTLADLKAASAALSWDQETYMPDGAAQARAEQLSTIDTLVHQMTVAPECRALVNGLQEDAGNNGMGTWQAAAVREFARTQQLAVKLPESFVGELSRVESLAQNDWKRARKASDFSMFRDSLTKMVDLKRKQAGYYGYSDNIYDALIDLFEPGMTVTQLRPVFDRLKEGTTRLLKKIAASGVAIDDGVLFTDFDTDAQLKFSREIIGQLGFDFNTGRIDLSAHPFCTSFSVSDVRLTTRVYRDDLRSCLFGLIHEAGHGMYEQGFDPRFERTPLASGISMGIHESQSLFWENMIGRSPQFWEWAFPKLRDVFPEKLSGMNPENFFKIINAIQPSFIRVEADELTYNLHIILRFEMEEALINGTMEVDDIPDVWNSKMQEYLGITPANDAEGCLQDVHWSFGGFGYFPSYTLGKLYAAMFHRRAMADIPDMEGGIRTGDFKPVLGWLRENIHTCGKVKTASELVSDVCGQPLTEQYFLDYVESKIDRVYSA